jgi:hypothetical protein
MTRSHLPVELDQKVRLAAKNRCGYCLSPQHLVMGRLHIEHIQPIGKGGNSEENNLWLACSICNGHKADKTHTIDPKTGESVPLFNPRYQKWFEHFRWSEDGIRIVGLTATGRATVIALHLSDDPDALTVRSYWVLAGWHPPQA